MAQDMLQHIRDALVARQPHCGIYRVHVYFFIRRALVQKAQRIAHAAVRQSGDKLRRVMAERKMLLRGNILKIFCDLRRVDTAEGVPLAA